MLVGNLRAYLLQFSHRLDERAYLIRLFAIIPTWPTCSLDNPGDSLLIPTALAGEEVVDGVKVPGDLLAIGKKLYYLKQITGGGYEVAYLAPLPNSTPLLDFTDLLTINAGDIHNYKGANTLTTTVGVYLLNYLILVRAFGDIVPYVEGGWSCGRINGIVGEYLRKQEVTVEAYHAYSSNMFTIGHFSELGSVNFTAKAYQTSPEVLALKAKLLEQYKDRLQEPEIMMLIEDALIQAHKEWLGDDLFTVFCAAVGSKAYDIHLKKLYLTGGAIPAFDETGTNFDMMKNSIDEGWDVDQFDIYVNEIYNASYKRGTETAKGGEQTKFSGRVYRDATITEPDCGSDRGYAHKVTLGNYKKLAGKYLLLTVNGKYVSYKEEELKHKIGQTITFRDPLYCKTKGNGYCFVCAGKQFKDFDIRGIGTEILDITSGILLQSMKNMHGVKLETTELELLNYFI